MKKMGYVSYEETSDPRVTMLERHFTTAELAAIWRVSTSTIVRWFRDREGVLRVGDGRRIELRIPLSVAARVYLERTGKVWIW